VLVKPVLLQDKGRKLMGQVRPPAHIRPSTVEEQRTEGMGKAGTAGEGRSSHAPSGAGATRLALMPPSAGGKAGCWASFLQGEASGVEGRAAVHWL